MSKQKLTPWFPDDVKPVRRGVYETEFDNNSKSFTWRGYAMWDGRRWWNLSFTIEHAVNPRRNGPGAAQDKRWRGRAAPGAQEGA